MKTNVFLYAKLSGGIHLGILSAYLLELHTPNTNNLISTEPFTRYTWKKKRKIKKVYACVKFLPWKCYSPYLKGFPFDRWAFEWAIHSRACNITPSQQRIESMINPCFRRYCVTLKRQSVCIEHTAMLSEKKKNEEYIFRLYIHSIATYNTHTDPYPSNISSSKFMTYTLFQFLWQQCVEISMRYTILIAHHLYFDLLDMRT